MTIIQFYPYHQKWLHLQSDWIIKNVNICNMIGLSKWYHLQYDWLIHSRTLSSCAPPKYIHDCYANKKNKYIFGIYV